MRALLACVLAIAWQAASVQAQMNSQLPNATYFLPLNYVGSNASGTPVPLYGCISNSATLQQLSFWANDQWLRGMEAGLTDGRQIQAGCLNVTGNTTGNGCTGSSLRNANFTFQSGERINALTLYPGYNVQGQPDQRAGALNFTTSAGRNFSFGMTATWQNGTQIDVGQGIPCGISPKAGADVDALSFVFLRAITADSLQNIQYSGVSSGGSGDVTDDVVPLQESASLLVISNQTYNNSGKTSSLVATFSSQADMSSSSQWTYSLGLDSYIMAPANGSVPQVVDYSTDSNVSWTLQNSGLYNRTVSSNNPEAWNYTITVGPQGASRITATATQGNITATYSANLNVTLDSGASFAVPVSGLYMGSSTSPLHVQTQELTAAVLQSSPTSKSGHNDTVPWVVGVLIGVICGLLLAALLAWAVVLIMRRRNKQASETQPGSNPAIPPKARGCLPVAHIPGWFQKSKGVAPEDLQKDVELGSAPGKGKWTVDEDPKLSPPPAVGVPMHTEGAGKSLPVKGDLPESDGRHVLPYNMFRRLRLNTIRKNLGLEGSDLTPVSAAQARLASIERGGDDLSNPPSGASTPRTIPEVSGQKPPSEAGAESIEAIPELGQTSFREESSEEGEKQALFLDSVEDEKAAVHQDDEERRQKMREQIAQRMAQRRPTPERPAREVSSKGPLPELRATMMNRISSHIASYKSQAAKEPPNPSGLNKSNLQSNAVRHEDQTLRLGAGYKPAGPSRVIEKQTIQHGADRIKLGVKYDTQGRNE